MLNSTLTGGINSLEAQAVVAAGKTPVIVDGATWSSMTASQFASYDAIVLGDPTCQTCIECYDQPAIDTTLIWGSILSGNVIIIGSDPVFHSTYGPYYGPQKLITQGVAFALAGNPGTTGAYIDLSCYYHLSGANTPVPLLDGVSGGGFTVIGGGVLPGLNDVHIVASHPALTGLNDSDLSNWYNSVHEAFNTWPVQFDVLAIARDPSGSFVATDGTQGYPYILARGSQLVVISDIHLTPEEATNPVGTTHTVTAAVEENGSPVQGVTVTFTVIAGPNAGVSGTGVTDANGQATFTYTGNTEGTDYIQASFTDPMNKTQSSNKATKEWQKGCPPPVATCPAAGGNRGYYKLTGASDCYAASELDLWVQDADSSFTAGPYPSGTIIRLIRSTTGKTSVSAGMGPAAVTIQILGRQALVYATDPAGQKSAVTKCASR